MAKTLDEMLADLQADERKLEKRRQALLAKQREAAIGTVERAGLFKLPLTRLEPLMKAVKALGLDEVESRLLASAKDGFASASRKLEEVEKGLTASA